MDSSRPRTLRPRPKLITRVLPEHYSSTQKPVTNDSIAYAHAGTSALACLARGGLCRGLPQQPTKSPRSFPARRITCTRIHRPTDKHTTRPHTHFTGLTSMPGKIPLAITLALPLTITTAAQSPSTISSEDRTFMASQIYHVISPFFPGLAQQKFDAAYNTQAHALDYLRPIPRPIQPRSGGIH